MSTGDNEQLFISLKIAHRACSYLWKQLWYLFYSEFLSRLTLSWILLVLVAGGFRLVLVQGGVQAQGKPVFDLKRCSQVMGAVMHTHNIRIYTHSGYKKGLGRLGFVVTKRIWADPSVSHVSFLISWWNTTVTLIFFPNMPREWSWLRACRSACPSSHATVLPCLVLFFC